MQARTRRRGEPAEGGLRRRVGTCWSADMDVDCGCVHVQKTMGFVTCVILFARGLARGDTARLRSLYKVGFPFSCNHADVKYRLPCRARPRSVTRDPERDAADGTRTSHPPRGRRC